MTADDLLLPEGSLLLHIGPHKTGTTSLQSAFHTNRAELAAHGVRYAGKTRQPVSAVAALVGKQTRKGERPAQIALWQQLVDEVNTAPEPRVIVSCESFADGDETIPRAAVKAFDRRHTHVVVTLRPLSSILPSAWQQYVQNGLQTPYGEWLEPILARPDDRRAERFWRRHDHAALVARWLDAVPAEDLTVVVVDEQDRSMLVNTFERFVGLSAGLLRPDSTRNNRSLTYGEAELHRLLNVEFAAREWSDEDYAKLLRHGLVRQLQADYVPGPDEPRVATPAWALQRTAELGAQTAEALRGVGVRIVGDLSSLAQIPASVAVSADGDGLQSGTLTSEAAARAIIGVILASRGERSARGRKR